MSLVGTYRINFTDPKKPSFIIEPYSTNGTVNATSNVLHSRATRADTSLVLPGQYVPKYGEIIAENMVHMLENFSGDTPPRNAIEGQLWYDTGDSFEIVSTLGNGLVLKGRHTTAIADYASRQDLMTVWYSVISSGDNTPRAIDVRLTGGASINAEGNTIVSITDANGNALTLPTSTIGGNLTPKRHSGGGRLRVARTTTDGDIDWADVADVECSVTPPTRDTLRDGTLWYDPNSTVRTLKIWRQNDWVDVSGDKLKLVGGPMAGHIHMGQYVITTAAADIQAIDSYPAADVLVPRGYVNHKISQAISSVQSGTDRDISDLMERMGVVETVLPGKLNIVGGTMDGTLVFGLPGTETTLSRGIDMNGSAILNLDIAWNPSDYLDAATQGDHAIDKRYLATALRQHLTDHKHESRGYITEQPNGLGRVPGTVFFADDHNVEWHRNGTTYSIGTADKALVVSSGSNSDDVVELRHGSASPGFTDPGIRVTQQTVESYHTLYILDGQPQPIVMGGKNDLNDDTAAATKGFVRNVVESSTSGLAPVIGVAFDYNSMGNTYSLELTRSQATPVTVDMYHTHMSDTLTYRYSVPIRNGGGTVDLVGEAIESAGYSLVEDEIPLSAMVTNLNTLKAPVRGAWFEDLPICGLELDVAGVSDSLNGLEIRDLPSSIEPGTSLDLVQTVGEDEVESTTYVVVSVDEVEEIDPEDPEDIDIVQYVIVSPALPVYEESNIWKVWIGQSTPKNDTRRFMTRLSFDQETRDLVSSSQMTSTLSGYVTRSSFDQETQDLVSNSQMTSALNGLAKTSKNITVTDNTSATASHDGEFIVCDSSQPMVYTIGNNLRPIVNSEGWSVELYQAGDGTITVAADAPVILHGTLETTGPHQVIKIRQVGNNTYVAY